VVIGDVNESLAKETQKEVEALGRYAKSPDPPQTPDNTESSSECLVQRCDVTSWEDQTALFEKTFERFGSIDIAVCLSLGSDASNTDQFFAGCQCRKGKFWTRDRTSGRRGPDSKANLDSERPRRQS
jgi:NAD(P)-dependent dehydrogenase (short-subunit alcohol dehydrogenase family)